MAYSSNKSGSVNHIKMCRRALSHEGMVIVAMTYDGAITDELLGAKTQSGSRPVTWMGGKKFLWELIATRKCMFVADEARRIKTPEAIRTKVLVQAAKSAPFKRILNGTPVVNSPFDVYSQIMFIDPLFWMKHGIGSYTVFKNMFGVYKKGFHTGKNGRPEQHDQVVAYKNLDYLRRLLDEISTRYTKKECLNLPEKLYSQIPFEMSKTQWKLYNDLKENYFAFLDSGQLVSAPMAITRMLRFQQIASGFIPVDGVDDDFRFKDIGKDNPRLDLLADTVDDIEQKTIVWCRFRRSIDKICDMLKAKGRSFVRYDGSMSEDECAAAKKEFQFGSAEWFVGNTAKGSEGLTLTASSLALYYENSCNLGDRIQSEDRQHRIGTLNNVLYRDLFAIGTVDVDIVNCLVKKLDIAAQITGDNLRKIFQRNVESATQESIMGVP